MKTNTLVITALFVILLFGCSKEDDSPILRIVDIESENMSLEKPPNEETIKLSDFN